MTKHNGRTITLGSRALIAGVALFGLAACQPVPTETTLPGNETTPTYAPTTTPTTVQPTTTTTAPAPPNGGWKIVGGDEFNDTAVDGTKWKQYYNTYGDGNNELACLMPKNLAESNGSLKIRAKKETVTCSHGTTEHYTSGFIGSRETGTYFPRYARFEIRAKLPHAQGMWPAFWLRHRNGASTAEVDVMEYFHSGAPGKTSQTLHLDGRYNISKKVSPFEAPTLSPGYHVWAVEISPDPAGIRFTFFIDGAATHTYVDAQHKWSSADPAKTWDMAINLAVGGRWTGEPDGILGYYPDLGTCAQGGTAPNGCKTTGIRRVDWANPANTTYEIDYVRVMTK